MSLFTNQGLSNALSGFADCYSSYSLRLNLSDSFLNLWADRFRELSWHEDLTEQHLVACGNSLFKLAEVSSDSIAWRILLETVLLELAESRHVEKFSPVALSCLLQLHARVAGRDESRRVRSHNNLSSVSRLNREAESSFNHRDLVSKVEARFSELLLSESNPSTSNPSTSNLWCEVTLSTALHGYSKVVSSPLLQREDFISESAGEVLELWLRRNVSAVRSSSSSSNNKTVSSESVTYSTNLDSFSFPCLTNALYGVGKLLSCTYFHASREESITQFVRVWCRRMREIQKQVQSTESDLVNLAISLYSLGRIAASPSADISLPLLQEAVICAGLNSHLILGNLTTLSTRHLSNLLFGLAELRMGFDKFSGGLVIVLQELVARIKLANSNIKLGGEYCLTLEVLTNGGSPDSANLGAEELCNLASSLAKFISNQSDE